MDLADYIERVPAARAERFGAIRRLITDLHPQAEESMRYKMPTYMLATGGWVALANQKHYISLYTCSPEHIAPFKRQYPAIKTGKGCINFRQRDEFDLADLAPVIHSAMSMGKTPAG